MRVTAVPSSQGQPARHVRDRGLEAARGRARSRRAQCLGAARLTAMLPALAPLARARDPMAGAARDGTSAPASEAGAVVLSRKVPRREGERWPEARTCSSSVEDRRIAPAASGAPADAEARSRGLHSCQAHRLHSHLLLHPLRRRRDDQVSRSRSSCARSARLSPRATLEAGFDCGLGTEGVASPTSLCDAIAMILDRGLFARRARCRAAGAMARSRLRSSLPELLERRSGGAGFLVQSREQTAAGADWVEVYADYRRGRAPRR